MAKDNAKSGGQKSGGLKPGDILGRYELIARIGAGGMGEVFRALDRELNRAVAVKVLPSDFATDGDRLARFQEEAQTLAALNHPNLLTVFDAGTRGDSPYLVSELLEGKTLREEMHGGPLPIRKAIDYGLQIASGLAAAHASNFVHRDIKPENLFVTNQGRVKILDFGLAKLWRGKKEPTPPRPSGSHPTVAIDPEAKTVIEERTESGLVMGTPAYMSPEQVTGEDPDHRSDIFSFGAVLYEMLTGQRAFRRGTSSETMTAVLREEPEDPAQFNINLPDGLDRLVRRCLEKRPEQRFQSASDLAFALDSLAHSTVGRRPTQASGTMNRWAIPFVVTLVGLVLIRMFFQTPALSLPAFEQVTFQRGTVMNARFAPDGKTVVYGARWNMTPMQAFRSQPGNPTPQPVELDEPNSDILSISNERELALLVNRKPLWWFSGYGTLVQRSLSGGGRAKPLATNIQEADWFPDGKRLVVVRWDGALTRCFLEEYPERVPLLETTGYFSRPRVSPKGDWIAFIDHEVTRDSRGAVRVVNRNGEARTLTPVYDHLEGMAWNPDGSEILFTAFSTGEPQSLRAVDLEGNERRVLNAPVNMALHDVAPDGTLLMARQFELQEIIASVPPGNYERNVTTLGRSQLREVSSDGSKFVVIFFGEGAGSSYSTYLCFSNGDPSVRLGDGYGHALSPDERWVFATSYDPPELVLLPTGPEPARKLPINTLTLLEKDNLGNDRTRSISKLDLAAASWLPDSRRLVVSGKEGTNGPQYLLLDTETGQLTEVTRPSQGVKSPTYFGVPISPDGKYVIGVVNKEFRMYPLEGGASWKLPGLDECQIAGWSADGNHLYIHVRSKQAVSPTLQIKRYNLAKKEMEPEDLKVIHPSDMSGSLGEPAVAVTRDGEGYVYFSWRVLTDLFLVKNLLPVR